MRYCEEQQKLWDCHSAVSWNRLVFGKIHGIQKSKPYYWWPMVWYPRNNTNRVSHNPLRDDQYNRTHTHNGDFDNRPRRRPGLHRHSGYPTVPPIVLGWLLIAGRSKYSQCSAPNVIIIMVAIEVNYFACLYPVLQMGLREPPNFWQ